MKRMSMKVLAAAILSLTVWSTTAPPASAALSTAASAPDKSYAVACEHENIDTVAVISNTRSGAIDIALECVKSGGLATIVAVDI